MKVESLMLGVIEQIWWRILANEEATSTRVVSLHDCFRDIDFVIDAANCGAKLRMIVGKE